MSNWYKKGKGRKSAVEKSQINDVNQLIEQHDIDISEFISPKTPGELSELRTELIGKYGSPEIIKDELPGDKPGENDPPEPSIDEPQSDPNDKTGEFGELKESSTSDIPGLENTQDNWKLSDFVENDNRHPMSAPFKKEDLFKASSFGEEPDGEDLEDEPSEIEENEDPLDDEHRPKEVVKEQPNDSVGNPWEKKRSPEVKTEEPGSPAPANASGENLDLSDDEKKKVKLAKTTSKKASENLAKQVTNLTCTVLEGGAKWYGKLPIREKKIQKLEDEGQLDRHFVVDKATHKTLNHLIDEHKQFLDEVISIDPDQKEDLMQAIMLVAEKHDVQVSPESNLMMVLLNIAITIGQASHQQKKKMERMISKVSDSYVQQSQRIAPLENENADLKEQLRVIQGGGNRMVAPPTPVAQPGAKEEPQDWMRHLSFGTPGEKNIDIMDEDKNVRKNEGIETASAIMEEVSSPVEGDHRTTHFKKVNIDDVKN